MDYQKKAEEILVSVYHGEVIDYKYDFVEVNLLAVALVQAYRDGVEAMRDAVMSRDVYLRLQKERVEEEARRLLYPAKGEPK